MKTIHAWMLIAASILIGVVAGISANAQPEDVKPRPKEFRFKVTSTLDQWKFIGVTPDRRIVVIVCARDLPKSLSNMDFIYSADLVFPNDGDLGAIANYRLDATHSPALSQSKPAYRPLSVEHATLFCKDPYGEFVFDVTENGAELKARRSIQVQSYGIDRRSL